MVEFEAGQTFLDLKAINYQGHKEKYFIALTDAEYDDDDIICFVMNTERRKENYADGCNKSNQKFVLCPNTFSFITNYTSIMLDQPVRYQLIEIYESNIKLLDIADEILCRQIKNCIDFNYIPGKFAKIIKDCYKNKKN